LTQFDTDSDFLASIHAAYTNARIMIGAASKGT
jgi:hypothetical protein